MSLPLDYYGSSDRGAIPEWTNSMAEMSWTYWLTFDGLRAAKSVTVPAIFIHSDDAVLPDNVRTVASAMTGDPKLVWTEGQQIDFYDQAQQIDTAIEALAPWFKQTLSGPLK